MRRVRPAKATTLLTLAVLLPSSTLISLLAARVGSELRTLRTVERP